MRRRMRGGGDKGMKEGKGMKGVMESVDWVLHHVALCLSAHLCSLDLLTLRDGYSFVINE